MTCEMDDGSRLLELRTQNFELRVRPVTPVSLKSGIGKCSGDTIVNKQRKEQHGRSHQNH